MSLEIGKTYGNYQIIDVLSSSREDITYKVKNRLANRLEAMKALPGQSQDDQELAERLLREIRVHAGLVHPNIVNFYNATEIEGRLVMTFELAEGATLARRLELGPLPWKDALRYITHVLAALAYIHERCIIHRDLTPSRIILTSEGLARLNGFSMAQGEADSNFAMIGDPVGSVKYMSPEQVIGTEQLDGRTDIYSAGVVLYEALTGKPPFDAKSQFEVMSAHVNLPPALPSARNRALAAELDALVLKALAKNPAQRYQTATDFRLAAEAILLSQDLTPAAAVSVASLPLRVVEVSSAIDVPAEELVEVAGAALPVAAAIEVLPVISSMPVEAEVDGPAAAVVVPTAEVVTEVPAAVAEAEVSAPAPAEVVVIAAPEAPVAEVELCAVVVAPPAEVVTDVPAAVVEAEVSAPAPAEVVMVAAPEAPVAEVEVCAVAVAPPAVGTEVPAAAAEAEVSAPAPAEVVMVADPEAPVAEVEVCAVAVAPPAEVVTEVPAAVAEAEVSAPAPAEVVMAAAPEAPVAEVEVCAAAVVVPPAEVVTEVPAAVAEAEVSAPAPAEVVVVADPEAPVAAAEVCAAAVVVLTAEVVTEVPTVPIAEPEACVSNPTEAVVVAVRENVVAEVSAAPAAETEVCVPAAQEPVVVAIAEVVAEVPAAPISEAEVCATGAADSVVMPEAQVRPPSALEPAVVLSSEVVACVPIALPTEVEAAALAAVRPAVVAVENPALEVVPEFEKQTCPAAPVPVWSESAARQERMATISVDLSAPAPACAEPDSFTIPREVMLAAVFLLIVSLAAFLAFR